MGLFTRKSKRVLRKNANDVMKGIGKLLMPRRPKKRR